MQTYKRIAVLMCLDALLAGMSTILAYYLKYGSTWMIEYRIQSLSFGALAIVLSIACLYGFKLYNRVWEYASIGEMYSLIKALGLGIFLAYAGTWLFVDREISFSTMLWTFETLLLGVGGVRFTWRMLRGHVIKQQVDDAVVTRNAMIVGAGSCGALIVKEMMQQSSARLKPICFVDDDRTKLHCGVYGIQVEGSRHDIAEMVDRHHIDDIIIAIPSASSEELEPIVEMCKKTQARVRVVPHLNDVILGKLSIKDIVQVDVEELLGRDPIRMDLVEAASYVTKKTVLITGAGGSIGSELCRQIALHQPNLLLMLGHGENSIYLIENEIRQKYPHMAIETLIADVQDMSRMDQLFNEYRPEIVFHAAAHKHVPLMECNPAEAVKNNIIGTRNVASCADRYAAERFVLISTDKAVNPTSVMGASKRIAELIVQSFSKDSSTIFAAVRFGNVLGSRGSVIPHFRKQIMAGGPVTVTHPDMIRYFMTIPEAVQLVIQAGALADGGEVFVLDMGKPVKIVDLARQLIRLSGYEPEIDIPIVYSGIRPGEKLFEELLTDEEGLTSTMHERIFIGKPSIIPKLVLDMQLIKLEQALGGSDQIIREGLRQLVPTYQMAQYEAKDKQTVTEVGEKQLSLV
ncbi:nucleoside-diphosphate sugar epimerase/dehydratase [Paenibacillus sp. UMB4589-SE434]|uniref:polysaccharide biosynthesis protein n=1 Tax=Paenibacillus sp. UMB4589-SE434 TaxID=3046314 RepID=UPI00255036CE|nr:nucleoside-diphosphate sugar epimerase/dehydratase [Paenibacillus sp. UMB4589-SE434]MDK8182001.1 nucleoside-diphosphate sugar epimerase/dehydratase [Paenibacillus sp. UMB4589-SE434]